MAKQEQEQREALENTLHVQQIAFNERSGEQASYGYPGLCKKVGFSCEISNLQELELIQCELNETFVASSLHSLFLIQYLFVPSISQFSAFFGSTAFFILMHLTSQMILQKARHEMVIPSFCCHILSNYYKIC